MKNVVARFRIVVLALILFGDGLLAWNHLRRDEICRFAGNVLITVAFLLALVPLIMFLLASLFSCRSKDGKE